MKRSVLGLVLVALMILPAHFGYAIDDTIVLYLPFDEGTGKKAKDRSMYGNDADIIKNTEWVAGQIGGAVEITGTTTDAVVVPSSDSLKIEGEITMMAWIKPTAWSGEGHAQVIDKNNHDGESGTSYGIALNGSGTGINMFLGAGHELHAQDRVDAAVIVGTGKWQHLAGTYDGETAKLYLNGELVGEEAKKIDFQGTNDQDVRLGCAKDRPQYTFNGSIDEVVIYSRALDEAEINQIMTAGPGAVSPKGKLATTWASIKNR